MVTDEIPIIGTVLDHFQPNQITQIQSGVEKISFGPFWASLGKLGQAHGQISHYQHRHCIPFMVLYHHTKNH